MRLLIAEPDGSRAMRLESCLQREGLDWRVEQVRDGVSALNALEARPRELLMISACMPRADGEAVLESLWRREVVCPPRVLLLTEPELRPPFRAPVDCVAPLLTSDEKRARLLATLSERICPMLARASANKRKNCIEALLDSIAMPHTLKGRAYIQWLLDALIHSPSLSCCITRRLYPACAEALGASAASVERCVRHAIEETFTVGSMEALERLFGSAIDPERGKLTNRAFLIMTADSLRQDLLTA